jgi:F-box and leucine-rich repeat protein 2/20
VKHLLLRGLDSVTNTTFTEILGPRCHDLLTLDIRRCPNANGTGLMSFAEQCRELAVETDIPCRLKTLKIANMKGTVADVMRLVGEAFPLLEVLDASYCKDLSDECFRAFVEWPTPSPEIRSGLREPEDWTKFGQGIELTSREAGFDPGDPTKYWRRISSLRQINLSGCRHISDGTCSVLAYSVPQLEFLEMAGVGGEVHDDGLIKLLKNTPLIRKIDLEDATEITDTILDCLTPEVRTPATSANGGREAKEEQNSPQPGEMLEHLVISCAMSVTPEAMLRLIRGCKKLRVLEADNTRITGNVIREFVNRRRHRERGIVVPDGLGSEIVGTDCRGVSEGSVRDIRSLTRPRRGWRDWEARELMYEDGQSVGVTDPTTGAIVGPLLGQDECDEKRIVVKSFHSWTNVDSVAEQRAKLKVASAVGGSKNGPTELPRWLTQWSLGRRSPNQSVTGSPEEREGGGCILQ